MSAFSNIPAQAVLPLGAYRLDELRRGAARADQRLLHADLHGAADADAVLDRLADAFELAAPVRRDLQALLERMTALKAPTDAAQPGFVVILENLPDSPAFGATQRSALLDVFRDAADHFYDRKTAFRVFYSVAQRAH